MRNSFGWTEQSQSEILFCDFTESRRGEFYDSQSSTDTSLPFSFGTGSLKEVAVWRCLPGLSLLCAALWPLVSPQESLLQCLCSHCPHSSGGGDCTAMGAIPAWPGGSVLEPNLLSPKQRSYYKPHLYSFSRASQWFMTDNCLWAPVRRCAINNLTAKWCLEKRRNGLGGL